MVSSFSIFFLAAFYFYFKQYYRKLIAAKTAGTNDGPALTVLLERKLMIFPAGIIAIALLYLFSFTLMNLYPDVDNVKSSRRVVDIAAIILCTVIFFMDKRELDKKLSVKKPPVKPQDINEPGIDIPEKDEII
ncbi:hypothetical protein BDD43_2740 [Mucilaginibacter gracilis]|uniref:Uncharacterized protein n=1 Tax=Mucilaginibacter gracilis TaxID=423350 RepID=A0A495J0P8_9SPHI|nr:hypothetical protein [Mucilaginibacter gracilis]RKR82555.1 hypothetical protein BDD43_2740 [Mucilaginibacter gracilis]